MILSKIKELSLMPALGVFLLGLSFNVNSAPPAATKAGSTMNSNKSIISEAQKLYDEQFYIQSYKLASPLAASGDAAAMYLLSRLYSASGGVDNLKPDIELSMDWLNKSANKKFPAAMTELGAILTNEYSSRYKNVPMDVYRGHKLISEAANLNYGGAMEWLGRFYVDGTGGPIDIAKAVYWFDKFEKTTGNASKGKISLLEDESKSRVGRDACLGLIDKPGFDVTLRGGGDIKLNISGTIVSRNENFKKVLFRVSSIEVINAYGGRSYSENFQVGNENFVVGRENWQNTYSVFPCW